MLGTIYLVVFLPVVALIAGFFAVRGSEREAERIRASEAGRRQAVR